jgi:predicted transglutaminase-like cysteine proteinase
MVLISITPYHARKIGIFVFSLLCLVGISCFAEAVFVQVPATPYDHQMTRIHPVLASNSNTTTKQDVTLGLVNRWIEDLRGIPYGFSPEWKTPEEVYGGPVADCKGKAVALYQRMHAHGAENLRLVIGKRSATSRRTHAWLEWQTATGNYILDPTINWSAFSTAQAGGGSYIPLYAYAGAHKYRAASAGLFAQK